jgi:hypothetical protein
VGWENRFRPLVATARRIPKLKELVESCFLKYPSLAAERVRHIERVMRSIEDTQPQRLRLYSTVAALANFDEAPWPLKDDNRRRLDKIVTRYVERSFLSNDGCVFQSPHEVNGVKVALQRQLAALTESVILDMGLDREVRDYGLAVINDVEERQAEQMATIQPERARVNQTSRDYLNSLRGLKVSFADIFCSEVEGMRLSNSIRTYSSIFYKFLRPWLRPQTLIFAERLFHNLS